MGQDGSVQRTNDVERRVSFTKGAIDPREYGFGSLATSCVLRMLYR